ncbi:MAG: type II secretion system protein N [Gammaproteobacteria bacterium]|nr:type II secretion system protein N [Gammaproteobacteria bacterium]
MDKLVEPPARPRIRIFGSPIHLAPLSRILLIACLLGAGPASASDLSRFSVLALGPLDGRAVVKSPGGKLEVLRLGDRLEGTQATLVQVLPDRAVLEDVLVVADRAPVRELVWMYKAGADGRSVIQRLSPTPPPPTTAEIPR